MTGSDSKGHRWMRRGEVLLVDWEMTEANNRQLTQSEETEDFRERPMMVTRDIAKLSGPSVSVQVTQKRLVAIVLYWNSTQRSL